jgi:enamine deaminase RidA (YjgF/YER057c/UK114 family)
MQNCNRRALFRHSFLVTIGGAAAALCSSVWRGSGQAFSQQPPAKETGRGYSPEERLKQLGIELPPAPQPVAIYVPAVTIDNILFVSGHGPSQADGQMVQGKVGRERTLEEGAAAARLVGLNVLSTVRNTLGSLDRVVRLVKVLGMVNCTAEFTQQPQVINGFSQLMVDVFGPERGKGARSAVGMASLPSNIAVEVEAIFQVRPA